VLGYRHNQPPTTHKELTMKRWLLGAGVLVLGIIVIGVGLLGFWPVPPDVPQTGNGGKAGAQVEPTSPDIRGTGKTLVVNPGQTIQAAVDKAAPGDIVQGMPGTYHEAVLVQTPSLSLQGIVQGDQRPVLDGQGQLANGVLSIANFFTVSGLRIINYTSNGATAQGTTGPIFRDLITDKTGEYGIFPILSSNILIENCVTSGVIDTGIYVGQSRGITVTNNEAYANVSGFEIENSVDAVVENNYAHDNTGGILVFLLPGKTATEGSHTRLADNRIENNNLANFSRPEMTVHLVPAGTGVLIVSADSTEVTANTFRGNKSFAVGLVALTDFPAFFGKNRLWDIPTVPENNWVHDNTFDNNGYAADPEVISAGFKGRDLLWSAAGTGNRWDEPTGTRYPAPLPGSNWPGFVQRAYSRALGFLAHL
jgi:cytochrome c peroxidase